MKARDWARESDRTVLTDYEATIAILQGQRTERHQYPPNNISHQDFLGFDQHLKDLTF